MRGEAPAAARFLAGTPWEAAAHVPLAGDASKRRYERLRRADGSTAILMIAPPETGEDVRPFARIARHLRGAGFSAPEILAEAPEAGFLLLEDLGDALFARRAGEDADRETALYAAAIDCLVALHAAPPPPGLAPMTARMLAEATDLATIWYAGFGEGRPDRSLIEAFEAQIGEIDGLSTVTVLRDFHAENLIWLPDRRGVAQVGLLDFQDALLGHRAYDLVSLLEDARRDLAPGIARTMTRRYLDATGHAAGSFGRAAATLGAQRSLRILGIFARLALRDGRPGYLDLLPRVWRHLVAALGHPALGALRTRVLAAVPPPGPEHLARFGAR